MEQVLKSNQFDLRRRGFEKAQMCFLKKVQFAPLTLGVQYDKLVPVNFYGEIAQLVERRTHKPKVKGSIPFLATNFPHSFTQGKRCARFCARRLAFFCFN